MFKGKFSAKRAHDFFKMDIQFISLSRKEQTGVCTQVGTILQLNVWGNNIESDCIKRQCSLQGASRLQWFVNRCNNGWRSVLSRCLNGSKRIIIYCCAVVERRWEMPLNCKKHHLYSLFYSGRGVTWATQVGRGTDFCKWGMNACAFIIYLN